MNDQRAAAVRPQVKLFSPLASVNIVINVIIVMSVRDFRHFHGRLPTEGAENCDERVCVRAQDLLSPLQR